MSAQTVITQLAEQFLNEKGCESVEILLMERKFECAKYYILGAVDSLFHRNQINDSEAAEAYRVLGIDPEKASRVRQNSPHWK